MADPVKQDPAWFRLAGALETEKGVCIQCMCTVADVNSTQPAALVRQVKQALGYQILPAVRKLCSRCDVVQAHYEYTGKSATYDSGLTSAQAAKVREFYAGKGAGTTSNFTTHQTNTRLEVDHRIGLEVRRARSMPPLQFDEDRLEEDFQLITSQENHNKRVACAQCLNTGVRRPFNGIDFWVEIKAEYHPALGCSQCPWAFPERWRRALAHAV